MSRDRAAVSLSLRLQEKAQGSLLADDAGSSCAFHWQVRLELKVWKEMSHCAALAVTTAQQIEKQLLESL